ncbi:efflux RND transporter periplasmic adaptor subunit [Aureimonas sp. SA4125]|uniref:efflux RND transporter periplasmic adaptor subunit n=1 Tax=Aureimonas sp. SA4125 TaxID=2826993 RepID=UPI001CC6048B|nr:efflux RND transporter periplasmic adaptor subunit [Aureimonas sp. SA4125]
MKLLGFSTLRAALLLAALAPAAAHGQAPGGAAPPPPVVTVETIATKTLPISYEYAGRVAASREVEVRARVAGILLDRAFVEGARVAPNQVLFRIDPREFEAQVALAQAQLQQQQATLGQAQRTEERQRALTSRGAASTATLDDATSSRELAEAQVAAAEASLQTARLSLAYATVTAPAGGVTTLDQVPEGSLITVNSLLTKISQLDPIYVNFSAADTEAIAIRQLVENGAGNRNDLSVEVSFGDGGVYAQKGTIDFTASSIDTETGTILSRAVLPNPDTRLIPGQFVRVNISGLKLEDAVTIPTEALMQGPQGPFVFTVDDKNVVGVRPIKIGRELDGEILVTEGLDNGDRIITEGVVKARPGSPVNPGDGGATPAAGAPAASAPASAGEADAAEASTGAAETAPAAASENAAPAAGGTPAAAEAGEPGKADGAAAPATETAQ